MTKCSTYAWLAAAFFTNAAFADVAVLTNGDRITGTVEAVSSAKVLMSTEYASEVAIDRSVVQELVTESSLDFLTGAGELSGTLEFSDGRQRIVAADGATDVALADIKSARQNYLAVPGLGSEWSSRATLAAILSHGNTDTESYNALIESVLKQDTVEHSVSLLISNEKAEEITTKDQFDLDYGYKRFISDQWYASGNAEYFIDELKNIDRRITLGAGMGYQFWDNSFGALSTDVSANVVGEEILGFDETNPALRWGMDYNRFFLANKLELFHGHSVLFNTDSDRGEVIGSSAGVRYTLNSRIDTAARVDVNHETKPAPGNSKTDVTYTIGVGVKF
jgi:putative salt-induced outer membrane protein YdiY